jgi:hypothetical protein
MAKPSKPKKEAKKAPKEGPVKLNMSFGDAIKLAVNTPPVKKKK